MKKFTLILAAMVLAGCATSGKSPSRASIHEDKVPVAKPVTTDFSNIGDTCAGKTAEACYAYAQKSYNAGDFRRAIRTYDLACARFQYLPACLEMAKMFEQGQGVEPNPGKAYEIYSAACYTVDHKPSCADMRRLSR